MDTYNILFLIRIHCKSETNGSEMWNRKIQKEQFWVMKNENESHLIFDEWNSIAMGSPCRCIIAKKENYHVSNKVAWLNLWQIQSCP